MQLGMDSVISAPRGAVMSIPLHDLVGKRFGRVVVTSWSHRDEYYNNYFHCVCDCGVELVKRVGQFRYGKFHTCGAEACRFWEKVNLDGPVVSEELGPCHVWTGATREDGYGVLKAAGSKKVLRAHVYMWELENGPIPAGLVVRHRCDNRICVRVDHLELGTHQDNMKDMAERGRASRYGRVYLSTVEKDLMRSKYAQGGLSHPSLAKLFDVSLSTVRRVLRGAPSRRQ